MVVVGVAVGWWWYTHRVPSDVGFATSTATVARREFSSSVLATGAIQTQVGAEVRVGARISGKVERLDQLVTVKEHALEPGKDEAHVRTFGR